MTTQSRSLQKALPFYLPDLCNVYALLPLVLTGELFALLFSLVLSPLPLFNWSLLGLLSIEILWIVLVGAALMCWTRPYLKKMSAPQGALLCFAILLSVISIIAVLGQGLLADPGAAVTIRFWRIVQHVAAGGLISGLVLRYFYLQQQLHQQQQLQLEVQMQARFQALQSRIRPHFLFNSMNIIASLIHSEPDTAEQVVEDLSTLFRASLGNEGDLVPLTHEINLCERYIHIEQLRLGERLQVNWHNTLQSNKHLVPALCLQPLLENAIYHGIQPRVEGGVIDIVLSDVDHYLSIHVSNPFDPRAPISRSGNGMALNNLEQRLLSRYGKTAAFSVSQDQETFAVSFSLPCESAP